MHNPDTFWTWTRAILVPGLYNVAWYNGKPFEYEEGFISSREAFMVGMPRLRQARIKPGENYLPWATSQATGQALVYIYIFSSHPNLLYSTPPRYRSSNIVHYSCPSLRGFANFLSVYIWYISYLRQATLIATFEVIIQRGH